MSTPARPRPRISRRVIVPVAALAAVGAAGGALALSGCGDTASAGSVAASAAGYIPADSPVYMQVSTDTSGPQWTQFTRLAGYFPGFDEMQAELRADLAKDGISWETELRPLLGDAAALAATKVPEVTATGSQIVANPAKAAGAAAASAADTPMLAVFQIADGKSQALTDLLQQPKGGNLTPSGQYNGATLYNDAATATYAAVTADALIVGSTQDVVKQSIDAHAAGGDQVLSGVFRFNDALGLLPKDVFAMGYVNIDELGKAAASALPGAEGLVQGQVSGAAAVAVTAESDGMRIKGVLVGAPPSTQQKSFSPTLTANAPADSLAYVGFNDLAGTAGQVLKGASEAAKANTKQQIDQVTSQLPLLLGVTGADLTNLAGGEHAVVITDPTGKGASAEPGLTLALKTADGAKAGDTLSTLSDRVPTLLRQFGPASVSGKVGKGFTDIPLGNGITGHRLPVAGMGDVVWGVNGDLAAIGDQASGVKAVLSAAPGGGLAGSPGFKAATQGMPDQVTGVAWVNVPQILPVLQARGEFNGAEGAKKRDCLEHITGIAAWGTQGDTPTVEVFVGMKK